MSSIFLYFFKKIWSLLTKKRQKATKYLYKCFFRVIMNIGGNKNGTDNIFKNDGYD